MSKRVLICLGLLLSLETAIHSAHFLPVLASGPAFVAKKIKKRHKAQQAQQRQMQQSAGEIADKNYADLLARYYASQPVHWTVRADEALDKFGRPILCGATCTFAVYAFWKTYIRSPAVPKARKVKARKKKKKLQKAVAQIQPLLHNPTTQLIANATAMRVEEPTENKTQTGLTRGRRATERFFKNRSSSAYVCG